MSNAETGGSPGAAPTLIIPRSVVQAMIDHCQAELPNEACGLLGGTLPKVDSLHPIPNLAASPSRYQADMAQVIDANRSLRERGAEILAIYHSHPESSPQPSQTDLKENFEWGETPRIIVSFRTPEPSIGVWRFFPEHYEPIAWQMVGED